MVSVQLGSDPLLFYRSRNDQYSGKRGEIFRKSSIVTMYSKKENPITSFPSTFCVTVTAAFMSILYTVQL